MFDGLLVLEPRLQYSGITSGYALKNHSQQAQETTLGTGMEPKLALMQGKHPTRYTISSASDELYFFIIKANLSLPEQLDVIESEFSRKIRLWKLYTYLNHKFDSFS